MNGLLAIAAGAGIQDALNPCVFITCAFLVLHRLWLTTDLRQGTWLCIVFGIVYIASYLEFDFGPAQTIIFRKEFILAAKYVYFVLGFCSLAAGVIFFRNWVLIHRGRTDAGQIKPLVIGTPWALGITVTLAVVLSALQATWPINTYIMLLGNETLMKGHWQSVAPVLAAYTISSLWPLWVVWTFLSARNMKPSLFTIIAAAIFLTASSSMILLFK